MSSQDPNKSYRSGGTWHSKSGDSIKRQIFYHGYLSRSDLAELLQKKGDFLVRSTQVDAETGKWDLVLSINTGAEGPNKIRHFVLGKNDDDELYHVKNVHAYNDPLKLIQEYHRNQWPLDANDPNTVLRLAIVTQRWELKHSMLTKGKKLGEGQYGDVFEGVLTRQAGRTVNVAIKSLKNTTESKEKVRELMQEARTVRRLHHRNIVTVHGVAVDELPIYIVMELCRGGSLDEALRTRKLPLDEKLRICLDVATGLEYLHSRRIIHRDVAARNCLYDPELKTVKISDFGLAKAMDKLTPDEKQKLPIKWLAPEVLQSLEFSTKSDVFAFGVLVWEVFADGAPPYKDMRGEDAKRNVLKGKRLQMPSETPSWLKALIVNHVWLQDPNDRCDMSKVVRLMERYKWIDSQGAGGSQHRKHTSRRHGRRSSRSNHSRRGGRSSHHKSGSRRSSRH